MPRSAPTPRDPPMFGRCRPSPSARRPHGSPTCLPTPGDEGKECGRLDSTLATVNTSHTRQLPLTRTKPTAEDVPCPCGCPRGFPTCLHTPGG